MHDHPVRHRFRGSRERSGWSNLHPLKVLGFAGAEVIAFGHERLKRLREWLAEGGAGHVQRVEEMLVHVIIEILTGDALDHVRRESRGVIRISRNGPGCKNLRGQMRRQILSDRRQIFFFANKEVFDGFFEAGAMGHDVAEGGGLSKSLRNPEVEILIHICVEV